MADDAGGITSEAGSSLSHLKTIIASLTTPIAIYNSDQRLIQYNPAFIELFRLDPEWMRSTPPESAILDHLRRTDQLPLEADYRSWRNQHLSSYSLTEPREAAWHLPDGRSIQVIAAPAGPRGGVIYVFEDITEQLRARSLNRALFDVQRSTIDALSDGIAVFATNGRLTIFNSSLTRIWQLARDDIADRHVTTVLEAVSTRFPQDLDAWAFIRDSVLDLSPTRSDTAGRINLTDGRVLEYSVVRLPDAQTMLRFADVTSAARYQQVLRERN